MERTRPVIRQNSSLCRLLEVYMIDILGQVGTVMLVDTPAVEADPENAVEEAAAVPWDFYEAGIETVCKEIVVCSS